VTLFATIALTVSTTILAQDTAPDRDQAPIASASVTQSTTVGDPESFPVPAAFNKPVPEGIDDLRAMQAHLQRLSARLRDCTVGVQIGQSQGSGVIVSEDGYVLTAAHVIGRPGRECRLVLPNGRRVRGRTLGVNRTLDAGLIRIDDEKFREWKWPSARMASLSELEPGDWCIVTGHPGGYQARRAPVLRLGRVIFISSRVLQTDCELVGGDSGGPLFDMQGRVIGVNSRIQESTSANYHVPVSVYQEGWERLAAGEDFTVHSGALLGVTGKPAEQGLEVTRAWRDEPAYAAGLRPGDTIVTFAGRKVQTLEDLTDLVGKEDPGDSVRMEILREGEPMTIRVRLGMRWD
jgi:serine protease Do